MWKSNFSLDAIDATLSPSLNLLDGVELRRHRRDSSHRSIATQPPAPPAPAAPRPKPPAQKAKPPVRVPTGGKYAKPRGRAPLNAEGKPASWDPDLGEWVGAYSGVSCNLQPSHLCVLRQASTRTRTTTVPPVSLSPSDNNAYTQASSRRRSRTASRSPAGGRHWARRGTTTRASGSAGAASPSRRGRRSRRPRKKMWRPAPRRPPVHAIAQLDGSHPGKVRRAVGVDIGCSPRFVR